MAAAQLTRVGGQEHGAGGEGGPNSDDERELECHNCANSGRADRAVPSGRTAAGMPAGTTSSRRRSGSGCLPAMGPPVEAVAALVPPSVACHYNVGRPACLTSWRQAGESAGVRG